MRHDHIDTSAIGSDVSRSRTQFLVRKFADFVVGALRLNSGGYLTTEIIQKINPTFVVPVGGGQMVFRAGHGRLRWRCETFYTEEPDTVSWLGELREDDVLWDVGANVGIYSVYAAVARGCRVVAFEPEAQNFAILVENLFLNGLQKRVVATNTPLTRASGFGTLCVHAMTKGGAYNQFHLDGDKESGSAQSEDPIPISQLQAGFSVDALTREHGFPFPTRMKIDVDGNEPEIIAGASQTLADPRLQSVLIELAPDQMAHRDIKAKLEAAGFQLVSERSNWESREDRTREKERPQVNAIFKRVPCAE